MCSRLLSQCFLFFNIVLVIENASCCRELTNFPDGFLIGTATSAYQVEGGWNASGKGENVWDWWTHTRPWLIVDQTNGDVACDHYHKYREDIELLHDLGVDFYRFSLSWSRILPTGFSNVVNEAGIKFYENILDILIDKGITPFVTLYHWDHPEFLEKMGGWTNDLMVDWFTDYARVVFERLGPKIKYITTINEPSDVCWEGYAGNTKAPGKELGKVGAYICQSNMLKAHAKAYHLYNDEFRAQQNGNISIVISCSGFFNKHPNDTTAADIAFQYECGLIGHPIFSETGDYPEVIKTRIAENSKLQGYSRSLLPELSQEWIEYIKGTADFYALNHYTSSLAETVPRTKDTLWYGDSGIKTSKDPNWPSTASSWLKLVPAGFTQVLIKIKSEYDNPPVYILENGVSDKGTTVDSARINYLYLYMHAMLSAIYEDECNVKGYTVWSLLDNFEWNRGYTELFGIVHVDFNSTDKTRAPKSSYGWIQEIIRTRQLQPFQQPEVKHLNRNINVKKPDDV